MNSTKRSQKYRKKIKEDSAKYAEYLQKEKERDKVRRDKKKKLLEKNTSAAKKMKKTQREKQNIRQRKSREKKRSEAKCTTPSCTGVAELGINLGSYRSSQTLGKAVQRAKRNLPSSPRKRLAVVKKLAYEESIVLPHEEKNSKTLNDYSLVTDFFNRDGISRQSPNKKDCMKVIVNGETMIKMKRHLTMTINECFSLFKEEYPTIKIGRTKFFDLRPDHVLPSSKMPHNTCVCKYHANIALLLEALKLKKGRKLIKDSVCDAAMEDCMLSLCSSCPDVYDVIISKVPKEDHSLLINWKQWKDVEGRPKLINESGSTLDAATEISHQFNAYKKHCYVKDGQDRHFQFVKNNLAEGEVALQVDFAENYATVIQDEIQAAHWSHVQITIFTAVATYKNNYQSYIIVSDNLNHGKHAVWKYLNILIQDIKKNCKLETLHVFSDGCAAQFKNRYNMLSMSYSQKDYGIKMTWSYFATSHGKGAVDGVGAIAKKMVSLAVMQRSAIVQSASDFAICAEKVLKKIKVFYSAECEISQDIIRMLDDRWHQVQSVPNIQSVHHVIPSTIGSIDIALTAESAHKRTYLLPQSDKTILNSSKRGTVGDFVEVVLFSKSKKNSEKFIGQIKQIEGDDIQIEYLKKISENVYVWPNEPDISWEKQNTIIKKLSTPEIINSRLEMKFN